MAAVNTGTNLVYLMTALILSLFLVSSIGASLGSRGMTGMVQLPLEAHEGEPSVFRIRLTNTLTRPRHMLLVQPTFEPALQPAPARLFRLEPGSKVELKGEVQAPMRGIYRLESLSVRCLYPAGLVASERKLPAHGELVVLPSALRHPLPVFPGFNQRSSRTETGSNIKGEGSAFYGLREYRPGDPIKKIHWKATARAQTPLVTEEEEDRVNRFYIFMDLRESKKVGDGRTCNLEVSIRIASTLARQLLDLNCPVRIFLMDSDLSRSPHGFSTGEAHALQRFLGSMSYTREGDFPAAVRRKLTDVPPGSYLIFILPDSDPGSLAVIDDLRLAPYGMFALFNLPHREAIQEFAARPVVRSMVRSGVTAVFFDGTEERVVGA